MKKTGLISIVMMTAISICFQSSRATEAGEQDARLPFMHVYEGTSPPAGYVGFCQRHPEDCAIDWGEVISVSLKTSASTKRDLKELQAVNNLVNEMVQPVTDRELYGRLEFWDYPAGQGDCEDYVLLKRRILMERGWPQGALLITVVRDENGDGHAVLTVRTDYGDVILDNKLPDVMAWNKVPYSYIKRQSATDPRTWQSLAPPDGYSAARTSGTQPKEQH